MALSREDLLKRGECCGLGCVNCPYTPKGVKGSKLNTGFAILTLLIIVFMVFLTYVKISNASNPKTFSTAAPEHIATSISLPARIISIHDGDTVTVEFRAQANIRLLDCWAPEITGEEKPKGLESKQFLETLIAPEDNIIVEIPFDGKIANSLTLTRILGKIYKDVDNDGTIDNISTLMTDKGFAKKSK